MKRFYCLPGLSKSSLNRCLRRLAAEQDYLSALSDIVTDCLPVAASADRGITVVDAPGSPSTSAGEPAVEIAGTMPGLRVRYSSVDDFTGSISDDILATPLSSSPYNRDPPPVRFKELVDSPGIRPLTSPTLTSTDERLDYMVQTVRQLSIRLKRVECNNKPRRFLSTDLDSETSGSDEMPQLECSFGDHSASHNISTAFLPSTPPPPIHKKSTEKRLSFSENTPPGATAADCATIHSPLSSSPYNRDPPPVRFRELVDSPGIRPLTSPPLTSTDERLDYLVQTVRQLSISSKRVECKLDFLTAERRKQHTEDVGVAVSCKEFCSPVASEVELMQLETKLQDNDTRSKLVSCRFESELFSDTLAVNLRWAILWRSGSSHTHESYFGSFRALVQPTWNAREDCDSE
ncbi:hypothetical protein EG68_12013 [Paragonimus skrjabini miyazakii]|uniref:Uncharacterized protein n=1 Tax=Paragonimus skrjabini miyazakii TaxID=59628 RepID=A0A8S9YJX7_9TREM|nr:hypothetical protein EG68_12013 [Paragonimus skrjabini miyazakii]